MGFLEDRDFSNVPTIPEFYQGKTLFITGGSGFMGHILIEKLLYSCTDLKRIYLLLRKKKNLKPEERLSELYKSSCFERLKEERPGVFESKVSFVAGDVTDIGLGLSESDRNILVNEVDIIFHVAASVRFDDTLSYAARMNIRGTQQAIELAKDTKKLCAFIHVSTSYSNTNHQVIEERIYPPLADWRETLEIVENVDDQIIEAFTTKYLTGMPNTYVFTKQLAEHVVYEQKGKIPVVIIRPSIVVATEKEPMPGWVNNFNGPGAFFAAGAKGIMRSLYTNPDLVCDYIPVDMAIQHFIAAGWIRGTKKLESTDDIPFYNCSASDLKVFTMKEVIKISQQLTTKIPADNALWYPCVTITSSKLYHYFKILYSQILPALLIDILLWVVGQKTRLLKIQRRIYGANFALRYYTTREWTFINKNFVLLRSCIKEQDKENFYYNLEALDKFKYTENCCWGGKKYLLKEKYEDIPTARAHQIRIRILDILVTYLFYGYVIWCIFNISYVQNIYRSIL